MLYAILHKPISADTIWSLVERKPHRAEAIERARLLALTAGGYVCVKDNEGAVIYGTDPADLQRVHLREGFRIPTLIKHFTYRGDAIDRLDHKLQGATSFAGGVLRWISNGRVPPAECVERAAEIGIPVDIERCARERDAETQQFLAEYRAARQGKPLSDEEQAGLRAAHGAGQIVVNVVTGDHYRT